MTKIITSLFLKNKDPESPAGREMYGRVAGIVGIICNALLGILKLVAGSISHSVAITADATNNISDAGSSVVMNVPLWWRMLRMEEVMSVWHRGCMRNLCTFLSILL